MRHKRDISCEVLILIIVFIYSCAPSHISPIPHQDRILCEIKEFEDLTGSYDKVRPSLEQLIRTKLTDDFTFMIQKKSRGDVTVFLANQFLVAPSNQLSKSTLIVEGQVEQIQYGRPQDVADAILAHEFLGLIGLTLSQGDKNNRAALLEYRINIFNSNRKLLKTVLLQGTCEANVIKMSREMIVASANKAAAEQFAWELNNNISKLLGVTPNWEIIGGRVPDTYPSALWEFSSQ